MARSPFDPLPDDAFSELFRNMTANDLFAGAKAKATTERQALAQQLFDFAAQGRALVRRWEKVIENRRAAQ